ncbi:MAG: cell division protein ZapA [Candidatus Omnitrophota bacterium]|jgi:cell division protein ZapA (FtsZ GTPase activity inhibitor)|nr:MAG: cell division protein ZapA [Candidatus Omnitrophota bacterium]
MPESDIISIEILGTKLQLRAGERPEAVKKAAMYVREMVHDLRERAPSAPSIQIALLTAINIANELLQVSGQEQASIDQLLEKAQNILAKTDHSGFHYTGSHFKSEFE